MDRLHRDRPFGRAVLREWQAKIRITGLGKPQPRQGDDRGDPIAHVAGQLRGHPRPSRITQHVDPVGIDACLVRDKIDRLPDELDIVAEILRGVSVLFGPSRRNPRDRRGNAGKVPGPSAEHRTDHPCRRQQDKAVLIRDGGDVIEVVQPRAAGLVQADDEGCGLSQRRFRHIGESGVGSKAKRDDPRFDIQAASVGGSGVCRKDMGGQYGNSHGNRVFDQSHCFPPVGPVARNTAM